MEVEMKPSTSRELAIPFSYSNTCGMGLETFDSCDCGGKSTKPVMLPIEQLPTPANTPQPHPRPGVKPKNRTKTHAKPLLFINHDAKHLKSQATRSEVTSHLRSAYQPWKHRMQARARREAGRSSTDVNSKTLVTLGMGDPYDEESRLISKQQTRSTKLQLHPSPAIHRGNSDPFSSLSITITPLIAELIKFEHAHLHPCIYSTKNTPTRAYGTSYLADLQGPKEDQAAVYGYLSRAAIVLSSASADPRFKTAALVLKGRSSKLLRGELASKGVKGKGDILRKILALMIAELFAHEYAAAEVHSRVLMGLLEERSRRMDTDEGQGEKFDMRFFFSVVYSEVQRSCMSLTRPCFDVSKNGWVSRLFESVGGGPFRRLVGAMEVDESPLEPSVLGIELAEIFGEVRTVRKVSEEYSNSPLYGSPTPLALYLPARVVLCLGRMVSFYVDHCAGREVGDLLPRELIHRAAVLGALYWVRKAGHIDSIRVSSTTTIHSAGPMILRRLRECLGRFDGTVGMREEGLYAGLRFWVLYIGAQEEQGRVRRGEVVEKWFTSRLVEASARVGVYTWQQARPILERYPHPDAAEPHGSTWFSGIFSDVSIRSTGHGLGALFAGIMPADTMTDLGKVELGGRLYGSGDDYMTWSTEEPMEQRVFDGELTCESLRQPNPIQGAMFVCPTWDIRQESYWAAASESPDVGMLGNGGQANGLRAGSPTSSSFAIGKKTGKQAIRGQPAINPPETSQDDPVTGWIGEQKTYTSNTKPAELAYRHPVLNLDANETTNHPQSASESHLFHSSAPCWQADCIKTPATKPIHRYTPLVNDPKLTAIKTGPVAFAMYPAREMDEQEALAEARSLRNRPGDTIRQNRVWESLRATGDEGCVMVAESWEHGVSCSWGGECPVKDAR